MKRTQKPKRHEYHITYDAAAKLWVCKVGGAIVGHWAVKDELVAHGAEMMDGYCDIFGQHSELIIHRKDGTIGKGSNSRRTYGGDDPKSKG